MNTLAFVCRSVRTFLLPLSFALAAASAAEPTSLKVEYVVFSGRPDPTFTIDDSATIRQITAAFNSLPAHPTLRIGDEMPVPQLGYRGFRVTPTGMEGIHAFHVYGNTVQVSELNPGGRTMVLTYRFDAAAALESQLSQIGRARGAIPDLTSVTVKLGATVTERSLTIELGAPIVTAAPLRVRAPTTVVRGTRVKFVATQADDLPGATVTWTKDGRTLPTSGRVLEIAAASSADSGGYWALVTGSDGRSVASANAALLVTSAEGQRLLNLSTLSRITSEQREAMAGFVIEGSGTEFRTLVLIRVVGPALASFGIPDGLRTPRLRVRDAHGVEVSAVVPSTMFPTIAEATQRTGAFALPASGPDLARLYYLPAGAFTATASSADGGTGAVLLELFEVL